jgi:decaprenylphospho-beta-D-erythro-pentofuranosid-2-ulose 2-reductase
MQAPDPNARAIAIFGATSDIAMAVARKYAEAGWRLVLVGRNADAMTTAQADLKVRGAAAVTVQIADFVKLNTLPAVAEAAWSEFGGLDIAFLAYGTLPDQAASEADAATAEAALLANFTSPVLLLSEIARHFTTTRRRGVIAAISSVAGDRGRMSNHIYGAAKGGLQRYLEGLRHRLYIAGVAVLDIRPGFVSTKMTAHVPQGGPLWATPEKVAADIVKAITARGAVLYTPWFWQGVMLIIRSVPRAIFHRTKL